MKTIDELKIFYDTNLKTNLESLESERIKIANKIVLLNVICGIFLGISVILFFIIAFFTLIIAIPLVILWVILYNKITKGYVSNFYCNDKFFTKKKREICSK